MPVTPEFFRFLVENRLHDSKAWFEEHREEYQRLVLEPLRGLVREMSPVMLTIDPLLVTQPAVGRTISRIYRDTRFTRDKSAFREHLWLSFSRGKAERFRPVPEFYFDLGPEGYEYGCGWYSPGTELMETLRQQLLTGDKTAAAAVKAAAAQELFRLEGETYKRPRHPEAPPELREWVERKAIYFCRRGGDPEFLYAEDLGTRVARELTVLKPVYDFLWKAQDTAAAQAVRTATAAGDW